MADALSLSFGADTSDLDHGTDQAADQVQSTADKMRQAFADMAQQVGAQLDLVSAKVQKAADAKDGSFGAKAEAFADTWVLRLSEIETALEVWRSGADATFGGVADQANRSAGQVGSSFGRIAMQVANALGNLALNSVGDQLASLNQGFLSLAAGIQRQSEVTGLSASTLGQLRVAEQDLGLTSGSLTSAYINLRDVLDGTAANSSKARGALQAMGISLEGLSGTDAPKVLAEIASKFRDYDDAEKRVALSNAVFGDSVGKSIVPALIQGGDAIKAYLAEAARLNAVNDENAAQAERIRAIQAADAEAARAAAERVSAAWTGLTDAFKEAGHANQDFWQNLKTAGQQGVATLDALYGEASQRLKALVGYGPGQAVDKTLQQPAPQKKATPDVPDAEGFKDWEQAWQDHIVKEHAFFADSNAAELAYWQEKLAKADAGTNDYRQVSQKIYTLQKEMAQTGLRDQERAIDEDIDANRKDAAAVVELQMEKLQAIRDAGGAGSQAEKDQIRAVMQAQQQAADQGRQLATEKQDTDEKVAELSVQVEKEALTQAQALHETNADDIKKTEQQTENEVYQIRLKGLQQKAELYKDDVVAHQQALDQIRIAEEQHALDLAKIKTKEAQDTEKQYQQMLSPISSSLNTAINGYIQGTQTLQQATHRALTGMLMDWLKLGEQSVEHWVASELAKTAATTAGAATRTATTTAANTQGMLASAEAGLKSVMNDAYKAAAATYASVSDIPYVGWLLAPAAGAGAFAAVAAFGGSIASAAGGMQVPEDMLAQVHKDERILPARYSRGLDALVEGADEGARRGAGGAGGDLHAHFHMGGFVDGQGAHDFLDRHMDHIVDRLAREYRNANPKLRPKRH